jgi:hypothetical protein
VLLAHSVDHGLSFRGPTVVDSNPNDDRPTMTVESVSGQPSHLFVSWTRSFSDHSEIWFARSVDGGATFTPAGMLYSSALTNFGAEPVVGPQGHVYVVWLSQANVAPTADGAAQVLFTASTDDGAHFGPVRGAGRGFTTLPQLAQPGSLRDLTTPTAAAAPDGTVYVAYAAVRDRHPNGAVDADIWLTRSVDQGATWSQPQRVNDVRTGDRFMPALRVLADGSLGVAFYDRRASPDELDVYAAHVAFVAAPSAPASRTTTSPHRPAAGPRFEMTANVRVDSAPSPVANIAVFNKSNSCFPPGRFFGDYIGAATDGTALDVVWTGPRPRQSKETDLWFARVALPAFATTRPRASVVPSPTTSGGSIFFRVPRKIVALVKRAAGFVPISNASGPLLIPVIVILLLPILAVTIAFRTLREARGS